MKLLGVGMGLALGSISSLALAQARAGKASFAPAPATPAPAAAAPAPVAPAPTAATPPAPTAPAPSGTQAPAPSTPPAPEAPPSTPPDTSAPPTTTPAAPAKPAEEGARVHWVDSGAETPPSGEEAAPVPAESAGPWSMGDASFVLSIDRITGLLAWNKAETIQVTDNSFSGNGMKHPVDIKSSGIDASFLTAGTGRTASAIPRLGFDLLTRAGVTLGGSLGYMSSTGKLEASEVNAEHDLGDIAVFVFSFRLGYLLQTSDNFGFWLRGGLTRVSVKASLPIVDRNGVLSTFEDTSTMWNVTLDPQLMFVVAPHVAITLGGLLDIGFTGTDESEFNVDSPPPLTSSAYGVTAGFAVLL